MAKQQPVWKTWEGRYHPTGGYDEIRVLGEGAAAIRHFLRKGKPHRLDGPALQGLDGREEWRIDGRLHREDGPAQILPNGTQAWFFKGQRHREGGPAFADAEGTLEWWHRGKQHREDGPAAEYADGGVAWFLNGIPLNPSKPADADKIRQIIARRG